MFSQALFADQLRGHHSTGVFSVNAKKSCTFLKTAEEANGFLKHKELPDLINVNATMLAGHNRWATQGAHTSDNAHPFNHGRVVMMHNGTLHTRAGLSTDKYFEVDSEHIAYSLGACSGTKEEYETATKHILENLDGAFALVWYDLQNDTLNFARNDERPFHYTIIGGNLYWASEKLMLEWILTRNKLKYTEIKALDEGKWVAITMPKNKKLAYDNNYVVDFKPAESYAYYGWRPTGNTRAVTQQPSKNHSLDAVGLVAGDYITFRPDFYVRGMAEQGTLFGTDTVSGERVAVFAAQRCDVAFLESALDIVDKDIMYTGSVTGISFPYQLDTSVSTRAISVSSSTLVEWEQPATDNVSYLVAGIAVSEEERKVLMDTGCAWCGHPFAASEIGAAKTDTHGDLYHAECHEAAKSQLKEAF